MSKTAVIFPGQGSQVVGMGQDATDASTAARRVFDRANDILGFDLSSLCFDGPAEQLEKTNIQQPAIFVTSIALWEAFLEAGGSRDQFSHAGGLSLGEYTALHISGALGFEPALRLVHRRGQLMQNAAEATPSGMVSLLGASAEQAEKLCEKARDGDVLSPANFNCPGQIVISGSASACKRAVDIAAEFDCRAISLAVAGAFHSKIMDSAAEGLAPVLRDTPIEPPSIPVIANVDAEYHTDVQQMRESLTRQVTQPVLWQRSIERLMKDGVDSFVEMGPGRVLTGLMRKIDRKTKAVNISTFDSIAAVVGSPIQ